MKKVLTLLSLLVTALTAMAADYSDKCTLYWPAQNTGGTYEDVAASVTDNGDGTSTVVLKSLTLDVGGTAYVLGDVTFKSATTTTSGDLTTYSLTDASKVSFENNSSPAYLKPQSCSAVALSAKSQGDRFYADVKMTFKFGYATTIENMTIVYGTDDFGTPAVTPTTTDFTDKCTLNWQDVYGGSYEDVAASVTDNGDGTSTVVLKDLTLQVDADVFSLGDVTFKNVATTTTDDVTTYSLTDASSVSFENCTSSYYFNAQSCSAVSLSAKSKDDRFYAAVTMTVKFGYYSTMENLKIVYGTDDFAGSTEPETPVTEVETKTYNGTWTSNDNQFTAFTGTVNVTEYSDGSYSFYVPEFAPMDTEMGGFTIPSVQAGEYEGLLHFAFEGEEESYINVTYGDNAPATKVNYVDSGTGYVDGDDLHMDFDKISYGDNLTLTNVSFAPTTEETTEDTTTKTFSGTWSNSNTASYPEFTGEVKVKDNEDGTYTFTVKEFTVAGAEHGNFTIENVPATTADGVTTFDFTYGGTQSWFAPTYPSSEATPGSQVYYFMGTTGTMTDKELKLSASAVNTTMGYMTDVTYNGTLVEQVTPDPTPDPEETTEQTFNGTWSNDSQPAFDAFTGDVTVKHNADGTYTFSVKEFTLRGTDYGNFTIDNVSATTEDGVTTFDFTNGGTLQAVTPNYPESEDTETEQTNPTMKVTFFTGMTGTMTDEELTLYAAAFATNSRLYYQKVSYNGKVKSEETPTEPTVEATDTYAERMTLNDGWQDYEFDSKTVNVLKYSDGTYALQFVAFEKNAEDEMSRWGDLTFKGLTYTEAEDGTATLSADGLTATVTDETSTYCGSEATLKLNGTKNAEGKLVLDFTVSGSLETLGTYTLTCTYGYEKATETTSNTYKGTWASYITSIDSFEGEVKATDNGDGTYTFYVKNFTAKGNEVGGFTLANVTAEVDDDHLWFHNSDYVYATYEGEKPSTAIEYAYNVSGTLKDKELSLMINKLAYGYEELNLITFNGTLVEEEDTTAEPTVVSTDIYDERMTMNDGWQDYEFDDKTVNVLKYSDGTYALQFVDFAKDSEDEMGRWGDLTFKGLTYTEAEDGTATLAADSLVAPVLDETSTYYESNAVLKLNGVKNSDGQLVLDFTVSGSLQTLGSYTLTCTYGYPKPEPKDTVTYTDVAEVTLNGELTQFSEKVLKVVDNEDGTYDFIYPDFNAGERVLGDVTLRGVTGTTDEETGVVTFSFEGNASIANLDGYCSMYYGVYDDQPFTMTGKLENGKLYAVFEASNTDSMYDFNLKSVFGYQTPTGISNINSANLEGCEVYSLNGAKLNGLQRGVNIVRKADGSTFKVIKK